jgi:hypothetical protein
MPMKDELRKNDKVGSTVVFNNVFNASNVPLKALTAIIYLGDTNMY